MANAEEKPSLTAGCFLFFFGGIVILIGGSMGEMGMGGVLSTTISIVGIIFVLSGCWQVWRRIAGLFGRRS